MKLKIFSLLLLISSLSAFADYDPCKDPIYNTTNSRNQVISEIRCDVVNDGKLEESSTSDMKSAKLCIILSENEDNARHLRIQGKIELETKFYTSEFGLYRSGFEYRGTYDNSFSYFKESEQVLFLKGIFGDSMNPGLVFEALYDKDKNNLVVESYRASMFGSKKISYKAFLDCRN